MIKLVYLLLEEVRVTRAHSNLTRTHSSYNSYKEHYPSLSTTGRVVDAVHYPPRSPSGGYNNKVAPLPHPYNRNGGARHLTYSCCCYPMHTNREKGLH